MRAPGCEAGDAAGEVERGAEPRRLEHGPPAELAAGDAAREAEVVADHRARAGLPAERLALEHQRGQAFRGAVDGGAQPGRTGADDGQVEHRRLDVDGDAEGGGELAVGGIGEDRRAHHLDEGVPRRLPAIARRSPARRASPGRGRRWARRADPGPRGSPRPGGRRRSTILTASTTGAVVHAHSPRSSVIAAWNSSSRGPVGLVSTVSTTPSARARDTAGIWSGRRPHSSSNTQRAVRVTARTPASTSTPSDADGRGRRAPSPRRRPRPSMSARRSTACRPGRHDLEPVVALVATELVEQPSAFGGVARDDEDHRFHGPGVLRAPTFDPRR